MKTKIKYIVLLLSLAVSALLAQEQPVDMGKRTRELQDLKWGMFICWSFSTFSGKEWTPGVADVSYFKATGCDTDQWAKTAKEAGMGYILFLTKHHDDFCLWDTNNHGPPSGDIRLGEMGRPGPLTDEAAAGFNAGHMKGYKGYLLAEFTYPIQPKRPKGAQWFYSHPDNDKVCHPARKLYDDYLGAVKFGNIFSIDVGPDYNGKLREIDVKTLREVGEMIRANAPMPDVSKNPAPIQ